MADMPAEDALNNNNNTVKRYIARLQRRKGKKCWAKCFFKFLKCYKTRILASIACVALITATFFDIQSDPLPPKKPNMTKKHDVELKPMECDHAGRNINKQQRKVVDIRQKQRIFEDKIRLAQRTFEYVRTDIKQNGGYVNTKQANKMTRNALQLSDADKGRVVDYACLYTGASILAIPDTSNLSLSDYKFFEFHIPIIYSQPPELITPDVTPGHCVVFWNSSNRQITRSKNKFIIAVTMENAPEAVIGDQIILAPRTFAVYGFEDSHKIKLAEISINVEKVSTQTFAIPKRNQAMAFAYAELRFLNNHGDEDLTCVYRVCAHGIPH